MYSRYIFDKKYVACAAAAVVVERGEAAHLKYCANFISFWMRGGEAKCVFVHVFAATLVDSLLFPKFNITAREIAPLKTNTVRETQKVFKKLKIIFIGKMQNADYLRLWT